MKWLRVFLTWPFHDRTDYDRWLGAQIPIPAWVVVALIVVVLTGILQKH